MAYKGLRFCDSPDDLARALGEVLPLPIAVVGVGNALCGDDGFGPAVVAALRPSDAVKLFDVQGVPESFLGPIVASGCPGVLFVDAADLGAEPGRVTVVPPDRVAEVDVSTHVVSLGLMARAVVDLAGQPSDGRRVICALLAAQPEDLKTIDRLSPAIERAVRLAAAGIEAFAKGFPAR
ncbi:MAG TPA: hydrogenase maturation protease [Phycisphaerae bacterium]|nr:hydrogenase maturation protease [Phycisphaerae bacterium]